MLIRRLARALGRNLILILTCLAAVLAAAYVVTEREVPQYASAARVLVSDGAPSGESADSGDPLPGPVSEERAATYAEVVGSQVLATRVADRLLRDPAFRGDAADLRRHSSAR